MTFPFSTPASELEEVGRGGTYKTFDEEERRLTDAERRFERRRRTVGLFLGPLVLIAMLAIPFDLPSRASTGSPRSSPSSSSGGSPRRSRSRSPGCSESSSCAVLEAAPASRGRRHLRRVVFGFFVDDNIFLFIGSFIIAEAMVVHGLHRRFAYRVLSARWSAGRRGGSSSRSG